MAEQLVGYIDAKKRWTGDFEYVYRDQCSVTGAAILGQFFYSKKYDRVEAVR